MKSPTAAILSPAFNGGQDIGCGCGDMSSEFYDTRTSYLSLKSSVLAPVSTRLTNQYLALEQLRAHYDMISRAKARIDTSSPKSLQSSLSLTGQKKREVWRTTSATSLYSTNGFPRTASPEILHNHYLEKGTRRHQKLEELGIASDGDITVGDKVSWYLNNVPSLKDKYSGKHRNDVMDSSRKAQTNSQQQNISIADKISWYLEAVQQGAFVSDLASSVNGCSSDSQSSSSNELFHQNSSTRKKNLKTSTVHPRAERINSSTYTIKSYTVPKASSKNQAKSKLRNMRCYNPPIRRKRHALNKKLTLVSREPESTCDNSSSNFDDSEDDDDDDDIDDGEHLRCESRLDDVQQIPERLKGPFARNDQHSCNSYSSPFRRYRSSLNLLSRSEEKYLDFIQNVTEDVLNTGIYTDRAIKKALGFHMKRQNDLDPKVVKQLIDQFLDDLCISKEDSPGSDPLDIPMDSAGRNTPPERDNVHFASNDNGTEGDGMFSMSVTATTVQTKSRVQSKDTSLEFESTGTNVEIPDKDDQVPDRDIFD